MENVGSPAGEFRIYLSSTLDDLRDERTAAVEILRKHGRVIDTYRAGPKPTVANCLADVRGSQLYVLIVGKRYGWVPAGEADEEAKSITELEYDACGADPSASIPRLVFVRTTNPDRFSDAETHPATAERVRRFRARAQEEQQAYAFDTIPQLTLALTEAVVRARAEWQDRAEAPAPRRAGLRVAPWVIGETLRPLAGHPVLQDGVEQALAGGAVVNLVFSHDHASGHGIVVTSLVPDWTYEPFAPGRPVSYEVEGSALTPQGVFTPERFTLVLARDELRTASWILGPDQGVTKPLDLDLLSTDPPRQVKLDAAGDDTISLLGVVRVTAPGRYALRWKVGFTVAGEASVLTTAPLRLVQGE
jgi:hypothetical protein